MTSRYVCLGCSRKFRKKVVCMLPTCKRCTGICAIETVDEETNQATLKKPQAPPVLATARFLQARRRLR